VHSGDCGLAGWWMGRGEVAWRRLVPFRRWSLFGHTPAKQRQSCISWRASPALSSNTHCHDLFATFLPSHIVRLAEARAFLYPSTMSGRLCLRRAALACSPSQPSIGLRPSTTKLAQSQHKSIGSRSFSSRSQRASSFVLSGISRSVMLAGALQSSSGEDVVS